MTSPFRPTPSRTRRGTISIFSLIVVLVLVGVVGLGLDTALVMTARQQLQRTADAAALAAAARVKVPDQNGFHLARGAAYNTAAAMDNDIVRCGPAGIQLDTNASNDPAGDIVVGQWAFDTTTHTYGFVPSVGNDPRADAVQVRAKCATGSLNSSLELLFGPLFGTNASNVGRSAIARQGRRPWPLILVLHPHDPGALTINGDAYMDVRAGTIQVDSDSSMALRMNGISGVLESPDTRVVGGVRLANTTSNIPGTLTTGADFVPDPLASLSPPSTVGMTNRGGITGPGDYLPGYYPDGINVNGGDVWLESGIYVIGSNGQARGIDLKGDSVLRSRLGGVHIYLEPNADFTTSGSGSGVVITPLLSGPYNGITMFMARTGSGGANIGGTGVFEIRGTLYLPNAEMKMNGNVTRTVAQMIVNLLEINGNARYEITGLDVTPPTGPQYVFLVN